MTKRQMKMFRERRPFPLGVIVLVWLVATVLVVLNINPIIGSFGRHYTAELPEAAGIKQGDPVRVSGVKVGRVTSVKLGAPGGGVLTQFTITDSDVHLGSQTSATVSVETVLGDKALVLTSAGSGDLSADATIPLTRTSAPYDVNDALTDLTDETGAIDVPRVSRALDTLSTTLDASAPDLGNAMRGIARLSATISTRDATLRELLDHADTFTQVLSDRSADLTRIVRDGNKLFAVLAQRRDEIRSLLVNVTSMSQQLRGFVADNNDSLKPALQQLNQVAALLQKNKSKLDYSLHGLSVYATGFGEVVSSGPFFTAYLQNLLPGNLVPPAIDLADLDLGGLLGKTGTTTGTTNQKGGQR